MHIARPYLFGQPCWFLPSPPGGVPFDNGKLMLGTWQQVVVIDFDNRPRRLNLVTQMIGE